MIKYPDNIKALEYQNAAQFCCLWLNLTSNGLFTGWILEGEFLEYYV